MQLQSDLKDKITSAINDFAASINSANTIVADMSSLVQVTASLPLSNLDYWERIIRSELIYGKVTPKYWELTTWMDLTSWDGYRREKILRTISGAAPNPFFFALTLRRLNDWVPQVREAAKEKLPLIAKTTNPKFVVESLCAVLPHWNSWRRIDDAGKKILLEIISIKEISEILKEKIISGVSGPWVAIFTQISRTSVLDKYLDEIANTAVQPAVRAKAYRSQFEGKMIWMERRKWEWVDIRYCRGRSTPIFEERNLVISFPLIKTLRAASIDRSPLVRRIAAEILIRELESVGEDSLKLAKLFAGDAFPSIAERGNFALRQLGM